MRLKCAAAGGWEQRVTPVCARDAVPSVLCGCTASLKKRSSPQKKNGPREGEEGGSSLAYKTTGGTRGNGPGSSENSGGRRTVAARDHSPGTDLP